jgi:predicted permease
VTNRVSSGEAELPDALALRPRPAELATGALASSYVNAGNLGVAIAAYVLGDASYVAPVLLCQVLVLAYALGRWVAH